MVRIIIKIIFISLIVAIGACDWQIQGKTGVVEVTDMAGNKVLVPDSIARLCSNGISLNQLFLTLGVSSRIIATIPAVKENVWYNRIDSSIRNVPVPFIGDSDVNIESLLECKPDLVVLWNEGSVAPKLKEAGIPVFIIRFTTPAEFKKAIRLLGKVLGKGPEKKARDFCFFYDSLTSLVNKRLQNTDSVQPVIYYSADGPLSTEGENSIVTSWISQAGGKNAAVLAGIKNIRADMHAEKLLNINPDIIVVRDAVNRQLFYDNKQWQHLKAVKEEKVWINPRGVAVWSSRNGESAMQPIWLATMMYPDLFSDVNMPDLVSYFFRKFYHYAPDSAEIASVLSGIDPV